MKDNSSLINGALSCRNLETITSNQSQLIQANHDLVGILAMKLSMRCQKCSWVTVDDLVSAGDEALVKATQSYDPSRGANFRTHASHCIWNEMLAEIRHLFPVKMSDKQRESVSIVWYDAYDSDWDSPNPSFFDKIQAKSMHCNWDWEHECLLEKLNRAVSKLDPKDQTLVYRRYGYEGEPMTFKQIATLEQVTPQAVCKHLNGVHDELRGQVLDEQISFKLCA
jgi:RNA polymerase sigma factor (sigma-70 family)